jgi:hypothetical protein
MCCLAKGIVPINGVRSDLDEMKLARPRERRLILDLLDGEYVTTTNHELVNADGRFPFAIMPHGTDPNWHALIVGQWVIVGCAMSARTINQRAERGEGVWHEGIVNPVFDWDQLPLNQVWVLHNVWISRVRRLNYGPISTRSSVRP